MAHTLTIKEIAAKTGRSVRHLQRLAAAGELPHSALAPNGYHRVYLLTDDLRKWIATEAGMKRDRRRREPKLRPNEERVSALLGHLQKAVLHAQRIWPTQRAKKESLAGLRHLESLNDLVKSLTA
jgi:hypothetical protein